MSACMSRTRMQMTKQAVSILPLISGNVEKSGKLRQNIEYI